MKNSIAFILVFLICLSLAQCRKDPHPIIKNGPDETSDLVVMKNINGMVFNTCTDSGLAGIKVYLKMYYQKKQISEYSTLSGTSGKYTFTTVELHSDPDYEQVIYIESKSGDNAKNFETCGILGTSMWFKFNEADIFMRPRVRPSFIYLAVYFIGEHTNPSDSVITRFEQRTYHKNVPDYPYKFGDGVHGWPNYHSRYPTGNYPMGLYHIVVDKWVSGVHTQWKDSLFTNYGDTAAYVVHW